MPRPWTGTLHPPKNPRRGLYRGSHKVDGKRHQRVDIYYSTIGLWIAPEPETLEQGYMAYYYQAMQKRKKRTA